jgi:UTP--glucose-1-phosphate uridylyltransferase
VGNEPFAIILPDDMIDDGSSGCLSQMVDVFREYQSSVVAIEKVDPSETDKYGIVSIESMADRLHKMTDIVEKPSPEDAPSSLAVVGRYILTAKIFDCLTNIGKGAGGEIQLTDAIKMLLQVEPVLAYEFSGKRFDCGSKLGYLKAKLHYALQDSEIKKAFIDHLKKIK